MHTSPDITLLKQNAWRAFLAAYAIAITLLCLPAIWNGFTLVFDDVGGYLERWPTRTLGLGRSAPYGLLLWITTSSWWIPVIILQATVTSWIIDRALKIFGLRRSPWVLPCVVAVIAATSGLAFFVSQVLPDAWAAPAVLALHLLAWHADSLTRMERAGMTTIVAFAGASHMATLGLLVGLSILHAVAWLARRRLRICPTRNCRRQCCSRVRDCPAACRERRRRWAIRSDPRRRRDPVRTPCRERDRRQGPRRGVPPERLATLRFQPRHADRLRTFHVGYE